MKYLILAVSLVCVFSASANDLKNFWNIMDLKAYEVHEQSLQETSLEVFLHAPTPEDIEDQCQTISADEAYTFLKPPKYDYELSINYHELPYVKQGINSTKKLLGDSDYWLCVYNDYYFDDSFTIYDEYSCHTEAESPYEFSSNCYDIISKDESGITVRLMYSSITAALEE